MLVGPDVATLNLLSEDLKLLYEFNRWVKCA